MGFLKIIGGVIVSAALAVGSILGINTADLHSEVESLKLQIETQKQELRSQEQYFGTVLNDIPKPVAFFETSLQDNLSSTGQTMTLVSATDKDGNTLASSTYGFVIDEGGADEELVIGQCTSTACTGLLRGISALTGSSTVTALMKPHRRGASVKITDAPLLLQMYRLMNGLGSFPYPLRYDTGITDAQISAHTNSLVNVSLLNATAIAGAPDMSGTVKGIAEQATGTEAAATNANGSGDTTAPLALTTAIATSSQDVAGNYVVVTKTDGKINHNQLPFASTAPAAIDNIQITSNALVGATTTTSGVISTTSVFCLGGSANCYEWPGVDGSNGQILQTNGSKKLSFTSTASNVTDTFIAGENIDASSLPQAVYTNIANSGVIKKTDINIEAGRQFLGFVPTTEGSKSTNQAIVVQLSGVVSGFSGLATGTVYYLATSTAGTITPGTPSASSTPIGIASSATELALADQLGPREASGRLSIAVTGAATTLRKFNVGFRPTNVIFVFTCSNTGTDSGVAKGMGIYSNGNNTSFHYKKLNSDTLGDGNFVGSNTITCSSASTNNIEVTMTISSVYDSGFTISLVSSVAGSGGTSTWVIDWQASR